LQSLQHAVDAEKLGMLRPSAVVFNELMSDIRSLIMDFHNLSKSIIEATKSVSATAQQASTAMEEISKTSGRTGSAGCGSG